MVAPAALAVQRKLAVSGPADAAEVEADRIAAQALRAPPGGVADDEPAGQGVPGVRRLCAACADSEAEEGEVRPRALPAATSVVPAAAARGISALRGGGEPMAAAERAFFEPRLGFDFAAVRIHRGPDAAALARDIGARAFTLGTDVAFAGGEYAPGSAAGRSLLAHELVHVVQQRGGARSTRTVQRACGTAGIGAPAGCAARAPVFVAGYSTYRFTADCDDLAAGEQARLLADAAALPPTAAVEVHGYSSTPGDAAFNQSLACARALRARALLTDPPPAGAGIPAVRIAGVFSHGPTPGPSSGRQAVVISPPTPTPLPAAVPAAGAADFRIERVGTSTPSRLFFARGSDALDAAAGTQIAAIRARAPITVRVIGYASADEPASVAQDRADAVRAALTAAPGGVTVTAAVGNAAATASRSDFTGARSVEVLVGATAPTTVDCAAVDAAGNLVNPPRQPCATMDPPTVTAFNDALVIANEAMTHAVSAVAGSLDAVAAPLVDRFFGNHAPATMATLRTNLGRLQTHVSGLPAITSCGGQCDAGGCEGAGVIGYNQGVDAASTMTLCVPAFKGMHLNDRARNLIHESAHGTSPLGGAPGLGTRDVAYRHERLLFQLPPSARLRNSDSYALFALFLRESRTTGVASAVPAGISTPSADTLTGFTGTEPDAVNAALAQLEKRLTWSEDWTNQLFGQVTAIRSGARTWSASWARGLMAEAAARFPLTAPPATPTLDDQMRLAAIKERYGRMKAAVKRNLTVNRVPAGVLRWTAGVGWIAGATVEIGPDFFRATGDDRIRLLFQALAGVTRDVEAAFVPAYASLAEWIHGQNP